MAGDDLIDLLSFTAVAQDGSFTRAASRLGITQSALSHAVKGLETRMEVRLLDRSTRGVSPTDAGRRLMDLVAPQFEAIEAELLSLTALRAEPAGTIRITAPEHAAETILWPALKRFLPDHPRIRVEVVSDQNLTDIVADRYDAGVRVGEYVEKDMVAVRIGPSMRMAIVGSPTYFGDRPAPVRPEDLRDHRCIDLRRTTRGGSFAWEFERSDEVVDVRVEGQLALTSLHLIREAALAGLGLGYLPEDMVEEALAEGLLVRVLTDWCAPFPGYHLYYPTRRQPVPAFKLFVDALRRKA